MSGRIDELLRIVAALRDPQGGCPWDRRQTFASIASCSIEEAYEVVDAIERGDLKNLRDELGDLLFQVVLHAQIGSEGKHFDFDEIAGSIAAKLIRRHPHVFGAAARGCADQAPADWEAIKAEERARAAPAGAVVSHLDGVPRALSALMRAVKLSKRAARVGFDWEAPLATAEKVAEELEELRGAIRDSGSHPSAHVFEEVGDLLFAAANLARKLGVDAEAALRAANTKFERRFRHMEEAARRGGALFESLTLADQESLWQRAKLDGL